MTYQTKQTKLQLASENIRNMHISIEDYLHKKRERKRNNNNNKEKITSSYGMEKANKLFNELFNKKK